MFQAVASIKELAIKNGEPLFDVEYNDTDHFDFCSDKTSSNKFFHTNSIFRYLSPAFGIKSIFFSLLMIVISSLKTWSEKLLMMGHSISHC